MRMYYFRASVAGSPDVRRSSDIRLSIERSSKTWPVFIVDPVTKLVPAKRAGNLTL